jgi:hypothetical protein
MNSKALYALVGTEQAQQFLQLVQDYTTEEIIKAVVQATLNGQIVFKKEN